MCEICNLFQKMCNIFRNDNRHFCIVKIHSPSKILKLNTTEVKGSWNEQKGKLKKKFAILTDNDLLFTEGKMDEMYGRLQIKLGKTKDELYKILGTL